MKLVAAALGGVVHVRARQTSVLTAVAVHNDRDVFDFVRPDRIVTRAGVVDVVEGIHQIGSV